MKILLDVEDFPPPIIYVLQINMTEVLLIKVALSDSRLQAGHLNTFNYEIHLSFQILLAEEGWLKNSEAEVTPKGAIK